MTDPISMLKPRQKECLDLVARGITSSKAISTVTGLKPNSIDTYLQGAAVILGTDGRLTAAKRFHELRDAARENSQSVPPLRIMPVGESDISTSSPPAITSKRWSDFSRDIVGAMMKAPPLGGAVNTLSWQRKTLEVLRVALFGVIAITALALAVAGVFKTFG